MLKQHKGCYLVFPYFHSHCSLTLHDILITVGVLYTKRLSIAHMLMFVIRTNELHRIYKFIKMWLLWHHWTESVLLGPSFFLVNSIVCLLMKANPLCCMQAFRIMRMLLL